MHPHRAYTHGLLAQLGEHPPCKRKVRSSSLLRPTYTGLSRKGAKVDKVLYLYNVCRTFARGFAAGAVSVLFNGKAEPFGVKFESESAVALSVGLALLAWLFFVAESAAKKRAGV